LTRAMSWNRPSGHREHQPPIEKEASHGRLR
jgi:hypothetical protein